MALVFDIETVGEEWNDLDSGSQELLAWYLKQEARDEDEYQIGLEQIKEGLGLSPLTGSIVAIGVYDSERKKGAVYFSAPGKKIQESEENGIKYKVMDEKAMLEHFWAGAKEYDEFVSFNGRCFDAPFLALRSMVHRVKPSKDLLSNRYLSLQRGCAHVDLKDQLTFYGAANFKGKNLHLFCRALGIKSPKAEGVTGDDVAELYKAKEYLKIATYNARDLIATTALYERWKETLR